MVSTTLILGSASATDSLEVFEGSLFFFQMFLSNELTITFLKF